MSRLLRGAGGEFKVFYGNETLPNDSVIEVLDDSTAGHLLAELQDNYFCLNTMREVLAEEFCGVRVHDLSDAEVYGRFSELVVGGAVRIARHQQARIRLWTLAAETTVQPAGIPIEAVTVVIRAQNGTDDPPTTVAPNQQVQLRGVPSRGSGTYLWSTTSRLVTLSNTTAQTVTVRAGSRKSTRPLGETIRLVFTPSGAAALRAVSHGIGVSSVTFAPERTHLWGYDNYERLQSRDKNNRASSPTPGPAKDFVSIKKAQVGKVRVQIHGANPQDIYFTSTDNNIVRPVATQATANPFVLELQGKVQDKATADIQARLGSATGTVLDTIGVVVLRELTYQAELFRVKDSHSLGTLLQHGTFAGSALQTNLNNYYKPGVATFNISGIAGMRNIRYDTNNNGFLDLEPGRTSPEQRAIIAGCTSSRSRVIYIHDLRWNYYLRQDAAATDRRIRIKGYATAYMNFIGNNAYRLEDNAGHSTNITVTSVNAATGWVDLAAPLGQEYTTATKAALIFPLAGLSGDPAWIKDDSSVEMIYKVIGHELGHQLAGIADVCEVANLMHGQAAGGQKLRHRSQAKYYHPSQNEAQWYTMRGR